MSRARLSDLLLKKKQANPKVAVRPAPKPAPEHIDRTTELFEDAVQEANVEPVSRSEEDVVPREESRSRRPETASRKRAEEPLGKAMIIHLLKTSEVQSISSDVIDAVKEVITTVVKDLSKFTGKGTISDEKLSRYIEKFVNDPERDIPSATSLSPAGFEMFTRTTFEEMECGLKRNSYFFFQQFVEWLIVKLMSKADMVAGVAKRARVTSVDLLVATHIYLE